MPRLWQLLVLVLLFAMPVTVDINNVIVVGISVVIGVDVIGVANVVIMAVMVEVVVVVIGVILVVITVVVGGRAALGVIIRAINVCNLVVIMCVSMVIGCVLSLLLLSVL